MFNFNMNDYTFTREMLEAVIITLRSQYRTAVKLQDNGRAMRIRIELEALTRLASSPVDHEGVWDFTA